MKILIAPKYNHYLEVTGEQLVILLNAKSWYQNYEEGYKYTSTDVLLEVHFVAEKDIAIPVDEGTLNIKSVMEENDRLIREIAILRDCINSSKNIAIIENLE